MVFWKSLEISKTKRTRPSEDSIAMVVRRDWMPDTGEYYTVNSTPSIMDDPSAHILDYKSYRLSMSGFLP